MTYNAAPNARRLARLAGIPCPDFRADGGWTFAVWSHGPRWGHIDVTRNRVTEFDPVNQQHRVIYQDRPALLA